MRSVVVAYTSECTFLVSWHTGNNILTVLKHKLKSIMKQSKLMILALLATLSFSACGTSDDLTFGEKKENTGGTSGSTDTNNTNKNVATADMPTVVRNAIGGLEFPKLKDDGSTTRTSYPIVHMDNTTGTVTFSTEWDDSKKSQRWSCYTFNTSNSAQNVSRWEPDYSKGERQYPYDTDLQEQWGITDFTADPTPTAQGFDHGHICPSADRKLNLTQQKQTFFMTNMQPQYSNFNQKGTWYNMESQLRTLAPKIDTDTLFVVKGGTIDAVGSESNILGWKKNGASSDTQLEGYVPIPKYFFVAVLKKEYNTSTKSYSYSAFGYWFPHENKAFDSKNDKLGNYVVNIKTLEEKTGIDFFCNLPDDIEKQVEEMSTDAVKSVWGFK